MNTGRNLANFTTANSFLLNNLDIQNNSGGGFRIYRDDPSNPVFSLNPDTGNVVITGALDVQGSATFSSFVIEDFENGMLSLASTNISNDDKDIGLFGSYSEDAGATIRYAGVVRDADDSLNRWTFFEGLENLPDINANVGTVLDNELGSLRINSISINSGTQTTPSLYFNGDLNTGIFQNSADSLAIAIGGLNVLECSYLSPTSTEITLGTESTLNLIQLGIINLTASAAAGVNSGSIHLSSEDGLDKWHKYYSDSGATTPSFAGSVFSSPTNHYFLTNNGGTLKISETTDNLTPTTTQPPDYRSATRVDILDLSTGNIRAFVNFQAANGSVAEPSLGFSGNTDMGFYRINSGNLGVSVGGVNRATLNSGEMILAVPFRGAAGSSTDPSISFSGDSNTGIYRSAEDQISFTTGGNLHSTLLGGSSPQLLFPTGGDAASPRIAFDGGVSGIYAPQDEAAAGQIAFSVDSEEQLRIRKRSAGTGQGSIEVYNSVVFTPSGSGGGSTVKFSESESAIYNNLLSNSVENRNYNIWDPNLVEVYNSEEEGAPENGAKAGLNGTLAGAGGPVSTKKCNIDANRIIKRNVLDFTSGGYIDLSTHISDFTTDSDTVSVSFWLRVDGTANTGSDRTILNYYSPTAEFSISILDGDGGLQTRVGSSGTDLVFQNRVSLITVDDNLWHHIVIIVSNATGSLVPRMYVDGVALTYSIGQPTETLQYTLPGNSPGFPNAASNAISDLTGITQITIGARFTGSVESLNYNGYLKNLYITKRRLTSAEVLQLYQETSINSHLIRAAVVDTCSLEIEGSAGVGFGSAAEPSIGFSGDSDTGLYRSGANELSISTGGVQRVVVSDTQFSYNAEDFKIDSIQNYARLMMSGAGDVGPSLVFSRDAENIQHRIITNHSSGDITQNYFDFYLSDFSGGITELGTNLVMRIGESAAGPDTGLITIYGALVADSGSVSLPSLGFSGDPDTGLYNFQADGLGIATGGNASALFDSTGIKVKSTLGLHLTDYNLADTDITSRVPGTTNGSLVEGYQDGHLVLSIRGDASNDFGTNSYANAVNAFTVNHSEIIHRQPTRLELNSTQSLNIQKAGAPAGGDIFVVNTVNDRIEFGYTNLSLERTDSYNSGTFQRLQINSTTAAGPATHTGLALLNTLHDVGTANTEVAELLIGRNISSRNAAKIKFNYQGDDSTLNLLEFGFEGLATYPLNIQANGNTNIVGNLNVSQVSSFQQPLRSANGTALAPSYSFTSSPDSGIFSPSSQQVAISAAGSSSLLVDVAYVEAEVPLRLNSGGNASQPSLSFSGEINTGFYDSAPGEISITNTSSRGASFGTQDIQLFRNLIFAPDGVNTRFRADNDKISFTSNQTILTGLTFLYFNFYLDPNINLIDQDQSVNRWTPTITGTITHNTNPINLTDPTGKTPREFQAIQISDDENNLLVSGINQLTTITQFTIGVQIKLITSGGTNNQIFRINGNSAFAGNFIRIFINSVSQVVLEIQAPGSVPRVNSVSSSTLTSGVWYDILLVCTETSQDVFINNISEISLSSSPFVFSDFDNTTDMSLVLGGDSDMDSVNSYFADFYVRPTATQEVLTQRMGTQAHEIYTNRIQLSRRGEGNVSQPGDVLRADAGENLVWDNGINLGLAQVQVNKLMRLFSGFCRRVQSITTASNISLDSTYSVIEINNTANIDVNLPTIIESNRGIEFYIIKLSSSSFTITLKTSGGNFIDSDTITEIPIQQQYDRVQIIAGTSRWYIS
jgi:hypothetical protein